MQLKLGDKIRELRRKEGRTQEALANALGVTSQAVSRWEAGGSYPDMEIIPSLANYFGVTIDELFGYECERDKKVEAIIAKIDSYGIKTRGDDEWVDECVALLREGLAEFPQNESLMITLADTLSEAGWRRYREWMYYDEEGYICIYQGCNGNAAITMRPSNRLIRRWNTRKRSKRCWMAKSIPIPRRW